MTISVPIKIDSIVSTTITDQTPTLSNCFGDIYEEGDIVGSGTGRYVAQRTIVPMHFDKAKADYQIGDVVWCSSVGMISTHNTVCYAMEGNAIKQPSDYGGSLDTSGDHNDWTTNWLLVRFSPYSWEGPNNDLKYTITPKGDLVDIEIKSIVGSSINYKKTIYLAKILTVMHLLGPEDIKASIAINPDNGLEYWIPNFILMNESGLYIRTSVNNSYDSIHKTDFPIFKDVNSASDVTGFIYLEELDQYKPFDGKNYTKVVSDTGSMSMTIKVAEPCNMFVLGYVIGDSFDYAFKDDSGSVVSSGTINIDGSRDSDGVLNDWYTTIPVYSSDTVPINGTIEITIYGTHIELGTFMPGAKVQSGMTNLTLTNTYRDFSTFEYDPWGNAEYIERAKVSVYTGTVDIPVEDYDRIDRLMTSLGKNVVILDGSDNTSNTAPDSNNVFASTQKIGRITSYKQNTVVKHNDMGKVANYSFTLEEIV